MELIIIFDERGGESDAVSGRERLLRHERKIERGQGGESGEGGEGSRGMKWSLDLPEYYIDLLYKIN